MLGLKLNHVSKRGHWCKKWRMVVNQDKSQIVHFRPPRHRVTDRNFTFGNHHLQTVNNYKYLGVMFDSILTISYNATNLSSSARRAVGLLQFKLKHLKQCGWSTYTKLFSSYICPSLDYCAGVWGVKTVWWSRKGTTECPAILPWST